MPHLIRNRIILVAFNVRRASVHQLGHTVAQIREPVAQDFYRDDDCGYGVSPPVAVCHPRDSEHSRKSRQPITFVHVGISLERLLVQLVREWQLHAPENEWWN